MERGQIFPNPYTQSPPFVPQNDRISPIQPGFHRTPGPYDRRGNQTFQRPPGQWRGGFGAPNQRRGSPNGYGHQSPSGYGQQSPSGYGHQSPSGYGHQSPSGYGHQSPSGYGHQSLYYSPNNSSTSYSSTPSSNYVSFNDSNGGPQNKSSPGSYNNSPGQGWRPRGGGSPGNYQGRFQHNQNKWSGNFGGGQRGGNRGNHNSHATSIRDYVSSKCCEDPWKELVEKQDNATAHKQENA